LNQFDANRDYYAILGASEDASPRDIEILYKRLAHKRHPDRGGSEEDMKALNEAYGVLRDRAARTEYDSKRRAPTASVPIQSAPAAREVGVYGQLLSALLCFVLGLMLLFLVRFNGLWFLWPLSILAMGVVLFGIIIAHAAMVNARDSFGPSHPVRRFRLAQEIAFWSLIAGGVYAVYLILTAI
jgi:hypothetical protein